MRGNLYVIGDSFATPQSYAKGNEDGSHFWCDIIQKNHSNLNVYVSGDSSRDAQTIIDIWIKLLPTLTKTDMLVIIVPFFNRTRLPLDKRNWKNCFIPDFYITDRFAGTASYYNDTIEFWGDGFKREYYLQIMSTQEIINASESSQLNFIEVIESVRLLSPINTYLFSWDEMKNKSLYIEDKPQLTEKLGKWETLTDDWSKSNGEIGIEDDGHWGFTTQKDFSDYIIEKFNLSRYK